jgi:hypothetical protein
MRPKRNPLAAVVNTRGRATATATAATAVDRESRRSHPSPVTAARILAVIE